MNTTFKLIRDAIKLSDRVDTILMLEAVMRRLASAPTIEDLRGPR